MAISGQSEVIVDDLSMSSVSGLARFAVSPGGTLVYVAGGVEGANREIVFADEHGRATAFPSPAQTFEQPSFAPDGRRFVVRTMAQPSGGLWIGDVERGMLTRLTAPCSRPLRRVARLVS